MTMHTQMKILILGGTNFMGKALIDTIHKQLPNAEIHVINRGKTYWNNEVYYDNPNIKYFFGDRKQHKQMHKAIDYYNDKIGISKLKPWNAVIDFTSYVWRDIQSIAKALSQKTQLYIFISSDSLYNNTRYTGTPIKQQQFSLQQAYKKQKGIRVADKYGYDKLKCELYLQRRKHLPYISLRLPDVLGPYDNTNRYWCILEWLKQNNKYALQLNNKDKTDKLSFVYSLDVAKLILYLIQNNQRIDKYKSYNLSFIETVTYQQLIQIIIQQMSNINTNNNTYNNNNNTNNNIYDNKYDNININNLNIINRYDQDSNGMYPSTDYICINCQAAIRQINWKPSTIRQCIKQTNIFFMQQAKRYHAQLKEMMREFKRKVINKH